MRREKGITLVALIITIIVLVILVGVSIGVMLNTGIIKNTETATTEYKKQQATEKMNLKIANIQMETYAEKQTMPTLQILADALYADEEIQYISLEKLKAENKKTIVVGDNKSIFTKLNEYSYEFEINSEFKIISIDGVSVDNSQCDVSKLELSTKSTTSSIKISVAKPECMRGNIQYCFSKDGGNYTEWTNENYYTFTGIYGDVSGVKCTIYVKAKDETGNEIVTSIEESTSKNMGYYLDAANTSVLTIGGRSFYKANTIPAIAAIGHISGYKGLFLVSTNADAVTYYTSYNTNNRMEYSSTIDYNGVTFYCSLCGGEWMPDNNGCTSNLKTLSEFEDSATVTEEVAKELLDIYYQTKLELSTESTTSSIKINVAKPEFMNGNIQYCFSKDGENYTEWTNENYYTFTGIYGDVSGVKCTIYVKAKDETGNEIVTSIKDSTSKNMEYYIDTANTSVLTIGGRNFYKANTIPAIAAIGHISGYKGLFLVSTNADAVTYYTSYNTNNRNEYSSTIDYNGVTFYCSSGGEWMPDNNSCTSNLKTLSEFEGSATVTEEVAKELLDLYYQ